MFSQVIARQCCRHVTTKQGVVVPAVSGIISSSSSSSMMINSRRSFSDTKYNSSPLKTSFNLVDPILINSKIGSSEHSRLPLTKIVATIGPTSEQLEPLQKVVEAGMKIMRLNFSHATTEEVELRLTNLAACQVCYFCF
jgi:hypothetical protein